MRDTRTARPAWLLAAFALIVAPMLSPGSGLLAQWAYALPQDRPEASNADLAGVQEVARAFRKVALQARPGVVHIHVSGWKADPIFLRQLRQHLEEQLGDEFTEEAWQELLNRFEERSSSGSGIIFDERGHILTNNHVVGGWEKITVRLPDERECDATLIGTDPKTDLAVVKIDVPNLHPLRFGDSDKTEVGDWVLAVGAPFGLTQSVTHGIISAKGRHDIEGIGLHYQDFLQTDAAINPGNSGGPLVNLRGEVVGVNTAISTIAGGYNMGVAFTISSNMAVRIARQLIEHGEVARGWLGISMAELSDRDVGPLGLKNKHGVLVNVLYEDSPAQRAGLQCEDVIVAVNDASIRDMREVRAAVADIPPGANATLKIIRDGQERAIDVRLGEQPENITAFVLRARAVIGRDVPPLALHVRTMRAALPELLESYAGIEHDLPGRAKRFAGDRGVFVVGDARTDAEDTSGSAEAEGIEPGSLIASCGGQPVTSVRELLQALEATRGSGTIRLAVIDPQGKQQTVHLRRD